MPVGDYSLTLKINDGASATYVYNAQYPMTPAEMFYRLITWKTIGIMADTGGGKVFLEIVDGDFGQVTGLYVEDNLTPEANTLTIMPSNDTASQNLYPYLAKSNEPKMVIHSCATTFYVGQ